MSYLNFKTLPAKHTMLCIFVSIVWLVFLSDFVVACAFAAQALCHLPTSIFNPRF